MNIPLVWGVVKIIDISRNKLCSTEQLGADLVKTSALETDLYLSVVVDEAFEFLTTKAKRIKNAIESFAKIFMLPGMTRYFYRKQSLLYSYFT